MSRFLQWFVGCLCDSIAWAGYPWYRKWRGGVWYHVRVRLDMYLGEFWSRYGAADFEMIERDIGVEIYAYDWQHNLVEVGDMVKICSYAIRDQKDRGRVFMVVEIPYDRVSVWAKLSDGNSYAPSQLMLVKGDNGTKTETEAAW